MELTLDQIKEARSRIESGESVGSVARSFDVARSTLSKALKSATSATGAALIPRQPLFWTPEMTEIRRGNFIIGLIGCFCLGGIVMAAVMVVIR